MRNNRIIITLSLAAMLALIVGCDSKKNTRTDTATTDATESAAKVDSIINQTKTLIDQNKYFDALRSLGGLSGLKLTPEQEKTVAGLRAQIQKGMSSPDPKAAGGQPPK